VLPGIEGSRAGVNYGMNNLRFIAPVRSGKRIRARFSLKAFTGRSPGTFQSTLGVTVDIEGEPKPALAVEWMIVTYL
jgi:acyl dehydratase